MEGEEQGWLNTQRQTVQGAGERVTCAESEPPPAPEAGWPPGPCWLTREASPAPSSPPPSCPRWSWSSAGHSPRPSPAPPVGSPSAKKRVPRYRRACWGRGAQAGCSTTAFGTVSVVLGNVHCCQNRPDFPPNLVTLCSIPLSFCTWNLLQQDKGHPSSTNTHSSNDEHS